MAFDVRTLATVHGAYGMTSAPHHLASEAGAAVLREGGSAAEAAVAMAAMLAVVYPHMNSLGGDSFWLLGDAAGRVIGVDACGRAAAGADLDLYRRAGLSAVPWRGPLAANTVAGTISGWAAVLGAWEGRTPLERLLEPAIAHAEQGFAVTANLAETLAAKHGELEPMPGFVGAFLPEGRGLREGQVLRQSALAETLRTLARQGLDGFYRGSLARCIAADLETAGSPLRLADLAAHRSALVEPLSVATEGARLYNMPPPTQGVASLLILALFDRLPKDGEGGFAHLHGLVEATKEAFRLRDRHVGDPGGMSWDPQAMLDDPVALDRLAATIDPARAAPWPAPISDGDTVWFGAIDAEGRSVSAIQSLYFEFGSGVVLPQTGITWQNRGASFRMTDSGPNALGPGRKPFHTLNPAMAQFADGRRMVYGTMGGEGQPQTQAAVFTRYARFGMDLQAAISAPRWLLGRTWGEDSTNLKMEDRFDPALVEALRSAGHDVQLVPAFSSMMGHAGAVVRRADGLFEGATDPRSDGAAVAV